MPNHKHLPIIQQITKKIHNRNEKNPPFSSKSSYLILAKGVDERDEVSNDVKNSIGRDRRRDISIAETTEIRGDGAIPTSGKGYDLVSPSVPELREAMDEKHHLPLPLLRDVHRDPIHLQHPMLDLFPLVSTFHPLLLSRRRWV